MDECRSDRTKPPLWIALLPATWMFVHIPVVLFLTFWRPGGMGLVGNIAWTALWIMEMAVTYGFLLRFIKGRMARHGYPSPPLAAVKPTYIWLGASLMVMLATIYGFWLLSRNLIWHGNHASALAETGQLQRLAFLEFAAVILEGAIMCIGAMFLGRRMRSRLESGA